MSLLKQIEDSVELVGRPVHEDSYWIKEGLEQYDPALGDNQKWVTINEIVVPTQRDKEQLLKAIEYLHYQDINTDFIGVNSLVHIYENPDLIKVRQN